MDKLWDPVEKDYRVAVERLENRSENAADIEWLILYVCAAGVRHPDFGDAVNRWRAEAGLGVAILPRQFASVSGTA